MAAILMAWHLLKYAPGWAGYISAALMLMHAKLDI
jgi:hypothetical protein